MIFIVDVGQCTRSFRISTTRGFHCARQIILYLIICFLCLGILCHRLFIYHDVWSVNFVVVLWFSSLQFSSLTRRDAKPLVP
ncbi:hypothetical protein F4680DRAFT_404495 [Xylaria scruposa]|nr:hypothetical protein F4680DRAFT_404495 [Xylaria scruposa]